MPDGERKIVFDKFHAMQQVGTAVDRVQKAGSRALAAIGDTTLTGTKYTWLKNPATFTRAAWHAFAALRESAL